MALATDADAISVRREGSLIFVPSTSRLLMRLKLRVYMTGDQYEASRRLEWRQVSSIVPQHR
jgi:hypothetical protein